jgi:hypothetical protein
MANSSFVHQQAESFARRLTAECATAEKRIEAAYNRLFARSPTDWEKQRAQDYLDRYAATAEAEKEGNGEAWPSLIRVLFASNEFVYID